MFFHEVHMQPIPNTRDRGCTQPVSAINVPEALLKIETVTAVTGLSKTSIRRKVAQGKFPAPVKDGKRCTRWVAGQVSNWLRAKAGAA